MKQKRNTKKGSYLVEATIIVPIFIMVVLMLISIIPTIGTCENVTFSNIDELSLESTKCAFRKNPSAFPLAIKRRVYVENCDIHSYSTDFFRYLHRGGSMADLLTSKYHVVFSKKNPMGLFSKINFSGRITCRAFTGKYQDDTPASAADFTKDEESHTVYIFPEWGNCYHGESCTYVKSNCRMIFLTSSLKRSFHPCKQCNASNAPLGTPVFCFFTSGDAYHTAGCRVVKKYYIQIDKQDAIEKGYTACSKCGGKQ